MNNDLNSKKTSSTDSLNNDVNVRWKIDYFQFINFSPLDFNSISIVVVWNIAW